MAVSLGALQAMALAPLVSPPSPSRLLSNAPQQAPLAVAVKSLLPVAAAGGESFLAALATCSSSSAFGGRRSRRSFLRALEEVGPLVGVVPVAHSGRVVVTREQGKNQKLIKMLEAVGVECLELPLIEHREGPDLGKLPNTIRDVRFEWIVITSPEAASVFLDGWRSAGSPNVRLAVVGSGTAEIFEDVEPQSPLEIAFIPSKANAKVLAKELPRLSSTGDKVLYPASLKASNDLEGGLSERGFEVLRLNTYSTDSVKTVDPATLDMAASAPVVALASPTAVYAWASLIDTATWRGAAACIGQTSAKASEKSGLKRIFYPESPGLEGWVKSILEALQNDICMTTA